MTSFLKLYFCLSQERNSGLKNSILTGLMTLISEHLKAWKDENPNKLRRCLELLQKCFEANDDISNGFLETLHKFAIKLLKYGMKNENKIWRPATLKTLRMIFASNVFKNRNDYKEEAKIISQMLFGHSQTLPLLMETSDDGTVDKSKVELVRLISSLISVNAEICSISYLKLMLGCYGGTMSEFDTTVVRIIQQHEANKVGLSAFRPIVWGEAAVKRYSTNQEKNGTLIRGPKVSEVLSLIHTEKMLRTAVEFPITLAYEVLDNDTYEQVEDGHLRYDPRFFLGLFCDLCAPGSFVDRHYKLFEHGVLALAIASLSSRDATMRSIGYLLLSRLYHQLERAKLTSEKQVWTHFINLIKNGIISSSLSQNPPRLPSIVTVFLIQTSVILRNPLDPLYKSITSFVLAKPMLDCSNVPEFLRLFYNTELNHSQIRNWLLDCLKDGIKDEQDYLVLQKSFASKVFMSYYSSVLCDRESKARIRQVFNRICHLPNASFDIVKSHGLNIWITGQLKMTDHEQDINEFFDIVFNAWESVKRRLLEKGIQDVKSHYLFSDFSTTFAFFKDKELNVSDLSKLKAFEMSVQDENK